MDFLSTKNYQNVLRNSTFCEGAILETISNRLKYFREVYLKINQQEMSEKLGYKQSNYSKIERGERNVNSELMLKLKELYNINLNWLISGEGSLFEKVQNGEIITEDNMDSTISINEDDFIKLAMVVKGSLEYFKAKNIPYSPDSMTDIILVSYYAAKTNEEMPIELKRKIEDKLQS